MQKQRGTHVAVELQKALILRKIRVPYPNSLVDGKLSREVAVHPPVGKVHKVYLQIFQVLEYFRVRLLNKRLHFIDDFVDTRLKIRVVVCDVVDELGEAPKGVGFCV